MNLCHILYTHFPHTCMQRKLQVYLFKCLDEHGNLFGDRGLFLFRAIFASFLVFAGAPRLVVEIAEREDEQKDITGRQAQSVPDPMKKAECFTRVKDGCSDKHDHQRTQVHGSDTNRGAVERVDRAVFQQFVAFSAGG